MGRARSSRQAIAAGGFEALLGSRRGSPAAQAERDTAARAEHDVLVEAELGDFRARVLAHYGAPSLLAELLVSPHRAGHPNATVAAEVLARVRANVASNYVKTLRELTVILDLGDPVLCPGLTAPVLDALSCYFDEGGDEDPYLTKQYAALIVQQLFGAVRAEDYYRRLAPLCAALAPLISNPVAEGDTSLGLAVAMALEGAPEAALIGPLYPWIDAFVSRIESKRIQPAEERELRDMLARHALRSPAGELALAELEARLQGSFSPELYLKHL